MKQKLLKTMLLLCALVVGGVTSVWAGDIVITLDNIGAGLTSTANTTVATTDITATGTSDTYTLNYFQCKKQGSAMLMTKSVSPFISNKTAMPGNIKSVEVFINSGASGKTTYDCAFSTTECTSATSGIGAVNITGGNSNVFSNLTVGGKINVLGKYFCVTLGNANNGQVLKLVITCENTHTLTYSATNGTISGEDESSNTVESGGSVAEGAEVTLTATPSSGYVFSSWSVSGTGSTLSSTTTNPTTFTMGTTNATVTANFVSASAKYAVTFSAPSNGTLVIQKAGVAISSGDEIADGTVLTIVATPSVGYNLVKWEYKEDGGSWTDGVGTSFTINGKDVEFRASFVAKIYHTITYSVNGVESTEDVEEGEDIDFSAPASGVPTGYTFKGWVIAANRIDGTTDTDPSANYVTSATCTADITYYAVMAVSGMSEPSLTKQGSSATFSEGDNIVIVAKGTTYALYQETVNTSYVKNFTFANDVATIAADSKNYLTMTKKNSNWYLGDNTNGYLYNTGSGNELYVKSDKAEWTIAWNSTESAFTIKCSTRYLSCRTDLTGGNANLYRGGGTGTTLGIAFFDIYKFVPSHEVFTHFCTTVEDYPVKIGSAGYTTYTTDDKVTMPDGVTAYIATAINTSTIHLEEVENVPADEPIILKADAGTYYLPIITTDTDGVSENILESSDGSVTSDASNIVYALAKKSSVVGFYKVSSTITVPEGKAYFKVATGGGSVKEFYPFEEDDATAIENVNGNYNLNNGAIYNISGQRLQKLQKGINIVNGKKVLF